MQLAAARGLDVELSVACPEGALAALQRGDAATHDRLVVESAERLAGADILMLGQFSMSHLQDRVARTTGRPVLSSPDSAVKALMAALQRR